MSAPLPGTVATAYPTPFGDAWVAFSGDTVVELGLPRSSPPYPKAGRVPGGVTQLVSGLTRYWRGGPLPAAGEEMLAAASTTSLTHAIYRTVSAIPAGATMTYSQVADAVGRPRAARAVGAATAANRFAPLIPCHRVVGSDGSLRGYAAGTDVKRFLLVMEADGADG